MSHEQRQIAGDVWAVWPDGEMCPITEIEQHAWKSDDFERRTAIDYLTDGTPVFA